MSRPSISIEPLGRAREAGDHPQRRRLARARGPEQRHELAAPDVEVDTLDRHDGRRRPCGGRGARAPARRSVRGRAGRLRESSSRVTGRRLTTDDEQQDRSVVVTTSSVVATAATVGSTTWRTCSHISTGSVRNRADVRKIATTTSSHDVMNAKIAPASTPGRMIGSVIRVNVRARVGPEVGRRELEIAVHRPQAGRRR